MGSNQVFLDVEFEMSIGYPSGHAKKVVDMQVSSLMKRARDINLGASKIQIEIEEMI